MMQTLENAKIAVIGLGYVGLPLAVEFGKHYPVVAFDASEQRIADLASGRDLTLEVNAGELAAAGNLRFTSNPDDIQACNVYIATVPTPVDCHKRPDFSALEAASRTIGRVIARGDFAIFESTVYPGATEEVCVPIIAAESGLRYNKDFFIGYSPERINPGDPQHRVKTLPKVTSGSTAAAAAFVDSLYASVIDAGTYKASTIRVAEAAKVIENTQRDVNIALINELALIFEKLGIDTLEVLEAAGSKWNFLPFRPGLVGGHCIGVDPYYLAHKAQEIGFHPEMILAGRRINDSMGTYVAERVVRLLTRRRIHVVGANILVMGLTFKENCPDLRNSRVVDVIRELEGCHANVVVHDPWVDPDEARREYGIHPIAAPGLNTYDAVIVAVAHRQFIDMGVDRVRGFCKPDSVLFDVKCIFPRDKVDARL
jgi:UDP-N-acetyl-D-galactosamine dehydrogenase